MKIQKFLRLVQNDLLNYPDISFHTVKMFIDKFKECLSEKEKEKNNQELQIISELGLQQISIDSIVHTSKLNNFNNRLQELKEVKETLKIIDTVKNDFKNMYPSVIKNKSNEIKNDKS